MLTKNMALVDASLPDDAPVVFLSHSVTPTDDTVEVLQQFAEAKGVSSARWPPPSLVSILRAHGDRVG